jgi:microcystin-dependent protein
MAEPFLGEIRVFSFGFPPKGWAGCSGQLMPINQNQALFSLLGTTYGGDGRVNFALPNLQARVAMHLGNGHIQGERGGEQNHTLAISELPTHIHTVNASANTASKNTPAGTYHAISPGDVYTTPGGNTTSLAPATLANTGGSQPHPNMQPFLTLNFCIALQGIFPSQN